NGPDVLTEAICLDHDLGKRRDIPEAKIEALPGNRVNAMRCVASERKARLDEVTGESEAQRPGAWLVEDADLAKLEPETCFKVRLKDDLVFRDQAVCIFGAFRPDDRGAVIALFVIGKR